MSYAEIPPGICQACFTPTSPDKPLCVVCQERQFRHIEAQDKLRSRYEAETARLALVTLQELKVRAAEQLLSLLEADPDTCPIVLGSARSVLKAVRNE